MLQVIDFFNIFCYNRFLISYVCQPQGLKRLSSTLNSKDEKMMKNFPSLKSNRMMHTAGLAVAASLFMAGCASNQAPIEQMAVSKAAVNNAMNAGSNEFAPIQLKSAMDKMNAAEKAMADKNYDLAKEMAEQAEVDAKLAAEMTRSAKTQKAANALQEDIRVLRQEIERTTK
jgi:hypothetical protein